MSAKIDRKKLKKTIDARLKSLHSKALVIVNSINLMRQNIANLEAENQQIIGQIKENENWKETLGADDKAEDTKGE